MSYVIEVDGLYLAKVPESQKTHRTIQNGQEYFYNNRGYRYVTDKPHLARTWETKEMAEKSSSFRAVLNDKDYRSHKPKAVKI